MLQRAAHVRRAVSVHVSLRGDIVSVRRCRRCGRAWPSYLTACRACAASLGGPHDREILLAVPEPAGADLPALILPVAVLALELSGAPRDAEALRRGAAEAVAQVLRALPPSAAFRTLPNGVVVALLALGSLSECAAAAARAATAFADAEAVDVRAGIGVGLADGADPLQAAVVSQAARLARAAQAGQRLCSYAAAGLLDRDWQFAPAGVLARRHEDQGEAATALLGRKPPAPSPSALARDDESPLVGREHQLALLEQELARARTGEARWCALVAPAGAGKSKLLRSWLGRLDRDSVTVIGAAGSPFGQAPRALVDRLLEALAAEAPDGDAAPALVASIRRADRPLVLVVDDLHWADGESLAILQTVAAARLRRCLVVTALRTSFLRRLPWLADVAQLLELPPLGQAEQDALLRRILPGTDAAPLRANLAAAPQGRNPLFLEQAAAYVSEAGRDVPVPASLHEVVLGRLALVVARLEGRARPSAEELASIEQTVGEWLDRLETEDYEDRAAIARYLGLLERIDAALVIAGSIAGVPQRRNRRLAAAIERFYSAGFAERVEAIERLAEFDRANAARAAATGAERALRAGRIDDAARYLELAQRLAEGEERARHLLTLGGILLARRRPARAWHALAEAARATSDDRLRGRCECRLGRAALAGGHPRIAADLLERALPRLRPEARVAAACDLAVARIASGDRVGARATLAAIEQSGDAGESDPHLLRARLRLALLDSTNDVDRLARAAASAVVFEGEAVADLATLVETTLLLREAAPDAVHEALFAEARRAAQRVGSATAGESAAPKMRRYESAP